VKNVEKRVVVKSKKKHEEKRKITGVTGSPFLYSTGSKGAAFQHAPRIFWVLNARVSVGFCALSSAAALIHTHKQDEILAGYTYACVCETPLS